MSKMDANDVARDYGPEGLRTRLDQKEAEAEEVCSNKAEWPLPTPPDAAADLPPFPVESLPAGWARDIVGGVAEATQTPPDLAGTVFLSVLGLCGAGKFNIQLSNQWTEPLNIYTVVTSPPGTRKSAVYRTMTVPILKWESREAERLGPDIARAQAERDVLEIQLKEAKTRAAKADCFEQEERCQRLRELSVQFASFVVPALPRLFTDDCTPERLASLMLAQGGRLAILSAESHVFEMAAGLYSEASNLNLLLKGHPGDAVRIDRQGRPSERMDHPALTISLCTQPEVISGLSAKPGFRGRGLLGRFLYALPKSPLGTRTINALEVSRETLDSYDEAVTKLLDLPWAGTEFGERRPTPLILSLQAQALFSKFQLELEPKLAAGAELGAMTDWAGKLAGAVARLAGGLHLAALNDEPWKVPVAGTTMQAAITFGRYFTEHAKGAFRAMKTDPKIEDACRVVSWIKRLRCKTFARRDVCRNLNLTAEQACEALTVLADPEHNILRARPVEPRGGPGRRPAPGGQTFEVNPNFVN